jgi:hypothetical protein
LHGGERYGLTGEDCSLNGGRWRRRLQLSRAIWGSFPSTAERRVGDLLKIKGQGVVQRGIELIDDFSHRAWPLLRTLRQHAHDERTEQGRNLPRRHQLGDRLFLRSLGIEMWVVRRIAGQQLVRQRAEPIDVVAWRR